MLEYIWQFWYLFKSLTIWRGSIICAWRPIGHVSGKKIVFRETIGVKWMNATVLKSFNGVCDGCRLAVRFSKYSTCLLLWLLYPDGCVATQSIYHRNLYSSSWTDSHHTVGVYVSIAKVVSKWSHGLFLPFQWYQHFVCGLSDRRQAIVVVGISLEAVLCSESGRTKRWLFQL